MIWHKHVPAHSMVICLCRHLTAGQLFYIMFIYFHLHLLYCHFSVLETPVQRRDEAISLYQHYWNFSCPK